MSLESINGKIEFRQFLPTLTTKKVLFKYIFLTLRTFSEFPVITFQGLFHLLFLRNSPKVVIKSLRSKSKALLHYKKSPLLYPFLANLFNHTNNWEVYAIVKILNRLRYEVHLIDSSTNPSHLNYSEYSLFIGLAGCGSGLNFGQHCAKLKTKFKIAYLTTAHPLDHENNNINRHNLFSSRTGIDIDKDLEVYHPIQIN